MKTKIKHEEKSILIAKFNHPQSDDYLDYKAHIVIKDSGKTPVQLKMKFDGIIPFNPIMPPKEHIIKAESILDLCLKIQRWLNKYGYKLV
jgi:hypothetical protein